MGYDEHELGKEREDMEAIDTKIDVRIEIKKSRHVLAQMNTGTDEYGVVVVPREELREQALKAVRENLRESEKDEVDEVRIKFPQRNGGAEFRFKREEIYQCGS